MLKVNLGWHRWIATKCLPWLTFICDRNLGTKLTLVNLYEKQSPPYSAGRWAYRFRGSKPISFRITAHARMAMMGNIPNAQTAPMILLRQTEQSILNSPSNQGWYGRVSPPRFGGLPIEKYPVDPIMQLPEFENLVKLVEHIIVVILVGVGRVGFR